MDWILGYGRISRSRLWNPQLFIFQFVMTVLVVHACIRRYPPPDRDLLFLRLWIVLLSLSGFTIAKVAHSQGAYNIIAVLIHIVGVNFFSAGTAAAAGAVHGILECYIGDEHWTFPREKTKTKYVWIVHHSQLGRNGVE